MTDDPIPWGDLTDEDRRNFTEMLNRRFNAGLTIEEAEAYYGNPEKVEEDFGYERDGGPECPECFTSLYREDIPALKRTGRCPYCGEDIAS